MSNNSGFGAAGGELTRIDRIADEFEGAWRRGELPRIEDYLCGASGQFRLGLIEELIQVEWQWRQRLGERPDAAEYRQRFPELSGWVSAAIGAIRRDLATTVDHVPGPKPDQAAFPYLEDYEILDVLVEGGMGVVYKARRRRDLAGSIVALKMIREPLVCADSIERFVKEMRNLARYQHPHIVQILDSGHEGGHPYYTMALCEGSDLARVLVEHGPLDPTTAALYVHAIASAVQHLHSRAEDPLIHRDLKPKNILLDRHIDGRFRYGRPLLSDFGLSKLRAELLLGAARGAFEGTMAYSPPEQVEGHVDIGPESDVWGLGVVLFECLTGGLPFRGGSRLELSDRILHQETPSLRAIRPEVPRALQRICLKCLKKSPADRYRTVRHLRVDLDAFREGEPLIYAQPETPLERFVQWTQRVPSLAARLAIIVTCSAVMWAFPSMPGTDHLADPVVEAFLSRLGHDVQGQRQQVEVVLMWAIQALLIGWGLISWIFQRQLLRSRRDDGLQIAWRLSDVAVLIFILLLDDALMSPLTILFPALIVASAFWARPGEIIRTTLLSMAGYSYLAVFHWLTHAGWDHPYRHVHYLIWLALTGLMLAYQANRTQALARISGRPSSSANAAASSGVGPPSLSRSRPQPGPAGSAFRRGGSPADRVRRTSRFLRRWCRLALRTVFGVIVTSSDHSSSRSVSFSRPGGGSS
jgi:serine/threonine-protein kinase